ncbi:MAG: hypothetical protein R2715_21035 [Ilumatobacteraceae bacterium]
MGMAVAVVLEHHGALGDESALVDGLVRRTNPFSHSQCMGPDSFGQFLRSDFP